MIESLISENPMFEDEYKVIGNPTEQTVSCSCGQFKRIGLLCAHAIKVLDLMNIRVLPAHYILRRWTREAQCGTIQDNRGRLMKILNWMPFSVTNFCH
jgi:hypothetical protein